MGSRSLCSTCRHGGWPARTGGHLVRPGGGPQHVHGVRLQGRDVRHCPGLCGDCLQCVKHYFQYSRLHSSCSCWVTSHRLHRHKPVVLCLFFRVGMHYRTIFLFLSTMFSFRCGVQIAGTLLYLFKGSATVQEWAKPKYEVENEV